jgi:predicted component of type VI protein secretion system
MAERYRLVMSVGPNPGKVFELTMDSMSIGRESSNDIVVQDAELSRNHARISRRGGGYVLEDLGSTNGTFINRQRITSPRTLAPGDEIGLGLDDVPGRRRRRDGHRLRAATADPSTGAAAATAICPPSAAICASRAGPGEEKQHARDRRLRRARPAVRPAARRGGDLRLHEFILHVPLQYFLRVDHHLPVKRVRSNSFGNNKRLARAACFL